MITITVEFEPHTKNERQEALDVMHEISMVLETWGYAQDDLFSIHADWNSEEKCDGSQTAEGRGTGA